MNRDEIEAEILRKHREIDSLRRDLEKCKHIWGNVVYCPVYHQGYIQPGDEPGTMGVDRRGSVSVPSRTERRWSRVCEVCGKREYTSQHVVKESTSHVPVW